MSHPSAIAKATTKVHNKPSTKSTTTPNFLKCSYRSKPCNSVRATKLNGDVHKLCEYHRRRANLNQQRVHQRRKLREFHTTKQQQHTSVDGSLVSPSSVSSSSNVMNWSWMALDTTDRLFDQYNDEELLSDIELEFEVEPSRDPCGDLPLPDIQLLELLLSENACNESMNANSQYVGHLELLSLNLLEA